jgi:hypothetical protein
VLESKEAPRQPSFLLSGRVSPFDNNISKARAKLEDTPIIDSTKPDGQTKMPAQKQKEHSHESNESVKNTKTNKPKAETQAPEVNNKMIEPWQLKYFSIQAARPRYEK